MEARKPLLGPIFAGQWSPDGKYLACVVEKTEPAGPGWYHRPLLIKNVKTGQEQELARDIEVRRPDWSADGRFILAAGFDPRRERQDNYNGGVYRIDVRNGAVTELMTFPPIEEWARDIWSSSHAVWAADGRSIIYKNHGRIVRRDVESGREDALYENDHLTAPLALSPDGKTLAFGVKTPDDSRTRVLTMPVSGGEPKERCQSNSFNWTPDGKHLLYITSEKKGSTIWRIPAAGGEPEQIGQANERVTGLDVHPDGNEIALSTFLQDQSIWVMENFLPGAGGRGASETGRGSVPDSPFSQDLITDPNTGLEFHKVLGITGSKDVIDMTYHGTHVDMSPNGQFLLYMDWIIPLSEGDVRKLTNGDLAVGRVRWSPDGTTIAFYSDGGIWVMPISQETGKVTGPAKRLVDGDFWYQFSVQWSPDSRKLVYRGPDLNLHVVSVRDGTTSQITTGTRKIQGGWSPDGRWIAYNQDDDSIWAVPSHGGQPRKLADVTGRGIPHWTPDGQWIVCQWNSRLRFIRFSDGFIADVILPDEVGAFISWSPDNEKMLFYKPSYVWRDMLRVISVSGGQPILPNVSSTGDPKWTPDGRFIFTWSEYQDRYLYWVTPFGPGAAEPYPLLLDKPYGYVPGPIAYAQESLSPSKNKLLFTVHAELERLENWVAPISAARGTSTGPAVRVFDKGPFERDACWSPDESKIALLYGDDLWIVHTDGSPPMKFTTRSDRKVVRRAWSPDGNVISWISHDPNSGQSALRIGSLSGGQSREIASTSKRIRHLWSPGGAWIAYEFYSVEPDRPDRTSTMRELFVAPASGGESRRLIESPHDYHAAFSFAWCPQGDQLALLCDRRLLLFNPASGRRQEISALPDPIWGRPFDMRWSPDGKMLGMVLEAKPNSTRSGQDISGNTRLFTVTVPEGKWTELAGETGTNYYFVWSPDGKWVAYNSEGWIRKRPEGILWEADFARFLNRCAAEVASVSEDSE